MSKANLAANLRTACNQQRSVAHVCRKLGINRQQFNKYLNGQVFPSRHNFTCICDYFTIAHEDFLLGEKAFKQLLVDKANGFARGSLGPLDKVVGALPNNLEAMTRYEGFYHGYYHALGFPGYILRNLIHIYRVGDRFYSKNVEHLWDKRCEKAIQIRFKYQGTVHYLGDRIFLTEHELLAKQTIAHTIIIPSYRNAFNMLSGLTIGVASVNSHLPKATRIEYEYLGKKINVREAFKACGLFPCDTDRIDADIVEKINNKILPHEFMLSAID